MSNDNDFGFGNAEVKMTKEQRIAMRQQRISLRRQKEEAKLKGVKITNDADTEKVSLSKTQIGASRDVVDETKATGWALVTDIRVDAELREADRRRAEEDLSHARLERVQEEVEACTVRNSKIDAAWAVLQKAVVAQDLHLDIQMQQNACMQVIASKDSILKEFHGQLKEKDDAYVKMLKQQQEDIATLLDRMHEQYATMQRTYEVELNNIDQAYIEERKNTLLANKKVIDALFEKRRHMELKLIEGKLAREDRFAKELDELRSRDAEDYNKLKMNLEHNIQLLEQQLEEMRATYQLNADKLEYNFRVLKERDTENRDTVNNQKTKIKRSKEALSKLKERYHAQETAFKTENAELTEEYKRITEQFKDLQRKFRHFEQSDRKKFEEIWAMNEERVMELGKKALKADQIIHEQILGVEWTAPPAGYFTLDYEGPVSPLTELGFTTSMFQANQMAAAAAAAMAEGSFSPTAAQTKKKTDSNQNANNMGARRGRFSLNQMRKVFDLLVAEAAFLIDAGASIPPNLSDEEHRMFQTDNILKALGVQDKEALEELVALFYADGAAGSETADPVVHPNDTIKVVRQFVLNRQQAQSSSVGVVKSDSVSKEKRDRQRMKERAFWQRLQLAISEKGYRVWGALETSLQKHVAILEERLKLADETITLQNQNNELKNLLKGYLSSKDNDYLAVPPSQVIRLGGTSATQSFHTNGGNRTQTMTQTQARTQYNHQTQQQQQQQQHQPQYQQQQQATQPFHTTTPQPPPESTQYTPQPIISPDSMTPMPPAVDEGGYTDMASPSPPPAHSRTESAMAEMLPPNDE